MKKGFFAYSSKPDSCSHSIEAAIKEINNSVDFNIKSWTGLNKYGKILIQEILKEIDEADFFCADLTGVNDNVLFEYGYAIAKNKPVFLIFDTSFIDSKRKYDELSILSVIGYENYQNSKDIVNGFYSFAKQNIEIRHFDSLIKPYIKQTDKKALLYLKSRFSIESTKQIPILIDKYKIPYIMDDASESKVQPFSWYIEQLANVSSILCEFMTYQRVGYETQNSKAAFVSGIARGLNIELLMICEEPYESPIDYKESLRKYNSPSDCARIVEPFLKRIEENIVEILTTKNILYEQHKGRTEFQKIDFGDFIAEYEIDDLPNYYVETYFSKEMLRNNLNIVVGRKGAGKSALLYYLVHELLQDKRKIVCLIKPVNFEIEGLISLIEGIVDDYEKTFVIEAIWKFLIITEISKSLYEKLILKSPSALDVNERTYVRFIEENRDFQLDDISDRLEKTIEKIKAQIVPNMSQSDFKAKVTESLHLKTIYNLKQHFAKIIGKSQKIIVLIDNLDKSWKKDGKISILSKIILALISSADRIVGDISVVKQMAFNIDFNLTIFLRSDIYRHIVQYAREPDKINPIWLKWDDFEVFFRIIEERFSIINDKVPEELWNKYISETVDNIPVKEYLISRILPRPRDVIYFFKKAHEVAISRGHDKINEEDLTKAYEGYSAWVFSSLLVENGITITQMEDFMYSLIGREKVVNLADVYRFAKDASIHFESEGSDEFLIFIDYLVSLSIIAREIMGDEFVFEYEFENNKRNKILSERLGTKRFKINPVLYPYLSIS